MIMSRGRSREKVKVDFGVVYLVVMMMNGLMISHFFIAPDFGSLLSGRLKVTRLCPVRTDGELGD